MFYQTSWLNISYEASFRNPVFELARENVEVLKIFHRHLTPRYSVSSSDMQALGGNALSDLKARITLFRGNGVLEITADKFSAIFTNAVGQQDIETIKYCVGSGLAAIAEWSPDLAYREEVIRLTAFLNLKGEADARDNFLHNLIGSKMMFRADDFGASKVHSGLKVEFENSGDKWIVGFDVSRSWANSDMLIVNCNATYQEGGALTTFDDKATHAGKMVADFLAKIELIRQDPA